MKSFGAPVSSTIAGRNAGVDLLLTNSIISSREGNVNITGW